MKRYMLLLFIFSILLGACEDETSKDWPKFSNEDNNAAFVCYQVDALEKVLKDYPNSIEDDVHTVLVAKGEVASFQLVLRMNTNDLIGDIQVEVSDMKHENGATLKVEEGIVEYVGTSVKFDTNPTNMIVSPTNKYPDPILPITNGTIPLDDLQSIWVSVPIPATAKEGVYSGKLTATATLLDGTNVKVEKEFSLKVYPVSISKRTLAVSNWLSVSPKLLGKMNNGIEVNRTSPEYWDIIEEVARISAEYHSNVYYSWLLHNNTVICKLQGNTYSFDFSNFDKELEIFEGKKALDRIIGKEIGVRAPDNVRINLRVPVSDNLGGIKYEELPLEDSRTTNFFSQFLPALKTHLEEKGWLDRYLQQVLDEPNAEHKTDYLKIAEMLRTYFPNIKITDAIFNGHLEQFAAGMDTWTPQLPQAEEFQPFFKSEQAKGKEVWYYTCMYPQGKYANRFIEQPLIATRVLHWINFKYGYNGFLHWGLNYWDVSDPYAETGITYMNAPGGDGFIVYPGYKKMYPSIRLEAMRDGINDYELLKLLESKNPSLAKNILDKMVTNGSLFNFSIKDMREQRKLLLEELSK